MSAPTGFKCNRPGCDKEYTTAGNLNQHIAAAHNGKRFYCSLEGCGKAYTRAIKLTKHESSAHPGQLFICPRPRCRRAFTTGAELGTHISEQHNRALFVCPQRGCNKMYVSRNSLFQHFLSQHESQAAELEMGGAELEMGAPAHLGGMQGGMPFEFAAQDPRGHFAPLGAPPALLVAAHAIAGPLGECARGGGQADFGAPDAFFGGAGALHAGGHGQFALPPAAGMGFDQCCAAAGGGGCGFDCPLASSQPVPHAYPISFDAVLGHMRLPPMPALPLCAGQPSRDTDAGPAGGDLLHAPVGLYGAHAGGAQCGGGSRRPQIDAAAASRLFGSPPEAGAMWPPLWPLLPAELPYGRPEQPVAQAVCAELRGAAAARRPAYDLPLQLGQPGWPAQAPSGGARGAEPHVPAYPLGRPQASGALALAPAELAPLLGPPAAQAYGAHAMPAPPPPPTATVPAPSEAGAQQLQQPPPPSEADGDAGVKSGSA